MKDFFLNQMKKSIDKFTAKKFKETYQAGLTDVKGPKQMNLEFYKTHVEVSYFEVIKPKSFTIKPEDIVTVELGVESADTTGKTISGAIAGNLLAGPLGALAMASHAGKNSKQEVLNLVINYKGEHRPFILQTSKHTLELYQLFKEMKANAKQ